MTLEEFEDITPTYFRYLRLRQKQQFKNERYLAAITAAAVYNVNRASQEVPIIDPIDFVRERNPKEENTLAIKRTFKESIAGLPPTSPEKLQEYRKQLIDSVFNQGRTDAEELFDECWPSLKPNK